MVKHSCLNCKKYHIEKDEDGYNYICDAEQKQEDVDDYRGKIYHDYWQWAACKPEEENDCPKFIAKG